MGYMPTFGGQARAVTRLVLLVAGVLLLITACSRPGQTNPQSRLQQAQARALAYSRCMRSHGEPNYPDPTITSHGVTFHDSLDHNTPQYKQAAQDCRKYRPGPSSLSPLEQAQDRQDGLKLAQCMHTHGFPNFPEPNSQGVIVLQPSDGIDTNSSQYQNAFNKCHTGSVAIEDNGG